MTVNDLRLSILTFPQRWDGKGTLDINIVVIPVGDPFQPLTPTGPPFAGTALSLQAVVISSLDALPSPSSTPSITFPVATPLPPNQVELFGTFLGMYPIDPVPIKRPLGADVRVRKGLPPSYLAAAGIDYPRTSDATVGDEFGCALLGQDPGPTRRGSIPPRTISWGALLSFSLRQPRLAQELGLLYSVSLSADPAVLQNGGWIYVQINPTDATAPYAADAAATPPLVRSYAARIPPLATTARQLFAAVLFPVVPPVADPSAYVDGNIEAQTYDDGFATIVHCDQPITIDAASGDHGTIPPATDAGLQIGWEDEQVTKWQNRQLDIARARQAGTDPDAEIPLGVLGYRLDVREDAGSAWTSLCMATQQLDFGSLQGPQSIEAIIEPMPVRGNRPDDNHAWLPRYFAQWRGGSLIGDDPIIHEMTNGGITPPQSSLRPLTPPVSLRYGHRYEFRIRLADLSGGGPQVGDSPIHPGVAAVAHWDFVRHVPPKAVRVSTEPPRPPMPPRRTDGGQTVQRPPIPTLTALRVLRPLIGYPEMRFAGLSDTDLLRFRQRIQQGINPIPGAPAPIYGIPDPDVDTLHITVEARSLAHDADGMPPLDGPFRILYEIDRPFPPPAADPLDDANELRLVLNYVDIASISSLDVPATGLTLPIPTGRDIRIQLTGTCQGALAGYFGSPAARTGITVSLATRQEASSENELLVPVGAHGVEAILLQPGTDLTSRLAQQLDLNVSGLTFSGRPGSRTVFAASRFLRTTLSGDYSALTLATSDELLHQWIVAIRVDLARDWTWDGLADVGIAVDRDDAGTIGTIQIPRTVSAVALTEGDESQRRELTHLVFLDAINPLPAPGAFPRELRVRYHLRPALRGKASAPVTDLDELRLPVTVRPAQVPRIASAGIALSPYLASADYSSTQPRSRALWLEFQDPIADSEDGLFARVLAYAPDPLLAPTSTQPDIAEEPPLSIPAETIRVIIPGQSRDDAGLAAMTQLVQSPSSTRHFLLPLPEGVDAESLLLFGMWTYEFRIGHVGEWSTAQARFGRPLRVAGVQHPAPTLICTVGRRGLSTQPGSTDILASAPLATPIALDGTRQERFGSTLMYFLLYAQARQADTHAWRNILLITREGFVDDDQILHHGRDILAQAIPPFDDTEIQAILAELALPVNSPLSVLAVELLPSGTQPPKDPMTADLGSRHIGQRILRASPLTPVRTICPPDTEPLPKPTPHPGLPVVVENQAPPPSTAPSGPNGGGGRPQ